MHWRVQAHTVRGRGAAGRVLEAGSGSQAGSSLGAWGSGSASLARRARHARRSVHVLAVPRCPRRAVPELSAQRTAQLRRAPLPLPPPPAYQRARGVCLRRARGRTRRALTRTAARSPPFSPLPPFPLPCPHLPPLIGSSPTADRPAAGRDSNSTQPVTNATATARPGGADDNNCDGRAYNVAGDGPGPAPLPFPHPPPPPPPIHPRPTSPASRRARARAEGSQRVAEAGTPARQACGAQPRPARRLDAGTPTTSTPTSRRSTFDVAPRGFFRSRIYIKVHMARYAHLHTLFYTRAAPRARMHAGAPFEEAACPLARPPARPLVRTSAAPGAETLFLFALWPLYEGPEPPRHPGPAFARRRHPLAFLGAGAPHVKRSVHPPRPWRRRRQSVSSWPPDATPPRRFRLEPTSK